MKIGVVGGGIAGLASAWALCKAGHRVSLFEQGPIPNPLGASGDHHRIIREGYGAQDGYARTIKHAFAAWEALWADLGERCFEETGVLCISRAPGDEGDLYTQGYERMDTPHERLAGAAVEERFPYLDGSAIDYVSFAPRGGMLFCRRIGAALAGWLRRSGAEITENARVEALDAERGAVVVAGERIVFDAVVVAAGAWTTQLFPDLAARLTAYRTAVVYLEPPADLSAAWGRAPVFLSIGDAAIDGYILPPRRGAGLKFGAGIHKVRAGPDERRAAEPGEGRRIRDHFGPPIARIGEYRVKEAMSCAYVFTADERFLAERRGKAWIVSACSGHGYKFGAAVGQRVARAVESGDEAALIRWIEAR